MGLFAREHRSKIRSKNPQVSAPPPQENPCGVTHGRLCYDAVAGTLTGDPEVEGAAVELLMLHEYEGETLAVVRNAKIGEIMVPLCPEAKENPSMLASTTKPLTWWEEQGSCCERCALGLSCAGEAGGCNCDGH